MHLDSVAVALHFQGRRANDRAGTYDAVDYRHSGTEEDRNVALPFRRHLATAGTARREVLRIQSRDTEQEIRGSVATVADGQRVIGGRGCDCPDIVIAEFDRVTAYSEFWRGCLCFCWSAAKRETDCHQYSQSSSFHTFNPESIVILRSNFRSIFSNLVH